MKKNWSHGWNWCRLIYWKRLKLIKEQRRHLLFFNSYIFTLDNGLTKDRTEMWREEIIKELPLLKILSGKQTTNGHPAKKNIHRLLQHFEPAKILVCIVEGTFSSWIQRTISSMVTRARLSKVGEWPGPEATIYRTCTGSNM